MNPYRDKRGQFAKKKGGRAVAVKPTGVDLVRLRKATRKYDRARRLLHAEIAFAYRDGASSTEIAEVVGLSRPTVIQIVKRRETREHA